MRDARIHRRQFFGLGLGFVLVSFLAAFYIFQIRILKAQEMAAIAIRASKGRSVEQIFREVEEIRNVAGCDAPVYYITSQPQVVDGIDPSGVAHFGLSPCRFQLARELPASPTNCSLLIHVSHPAYRDNDFGQPLYESKNYRLYRCNRL